MSTSYFVAYAIFIGAMLFIIAMLILLVVVINHNYSKRNKQVGRNLAIHEQDYWKLRAVIAHTPMHYVGRYELRKTLERWRNAR